MQNKQPLEKEILQNKKSGRICQKKQNFQINQNFPLISKPKQSLKPNLSSDRPSNRFKNLINKLDILSNLKDNYSSSSKALNASIQINEQILKRIEQKIYPLNKQYVKKIRIKRELCKCANNLSEVKKVKSLSKKKLKQKNKNSQINISYQKRQGKTKNHKRTKTQEELIQLHSRTQQYLLRKRKQLKINHLSEKLKMFTQGQQYQQKNKDGKKQNMLLDMNKISKIINFSNEPGFTIGEVQTKRNLKKKSCKRISNQFSLPESQLKKVLKLFKERQSNMTTFEQRNQKRSELNRVNQTFHMNRFERNNIPLKFNEYTQYQQNNIPSFQKKVSQQSNKSSTKILNRRSGINDKDFQTTLEVGMKSQKDKEFKKMLERLVSSTYRDQNKQVDRENFIKFQYRNEELIKQNINSKISRKKINFNEEDSLQVRQMKKQMISSIAQEMLDSKRNMLRKKINNQRLQKNRNTSIMGILF